MKTKVTHVCTVLDFYTAEKQWLPRTVEIQAPATASRYELGNLLPAGSILTKSKLK